MTPEPARFIFAAAAALLLGVSLGACGQKGPLYLPGDPSEIQTEIPPQPAEPDAADDPDEATAPTDGDMDSDTDDANP
jgi:predicted small lipoprotein YifL